MAVLDECLYYLRQRDGSANATSNDDPVLMLENKLKVIRAREKVGAASLRERGVDLWPFWRGTNVLSVLQLCLGLAKRRGLDYREGWQRLKRFEDDPSVRRALSEYKPRGWGSLSAVSNAQDGDALSALLLRSARSDESPLTASYAIR